MEKTGLDFATTSLPNLSYPRTSHEAVLIIPPLLRFNRTRPVLTNSLPCFKAKDINCKTRRFSSKRHFKSKVGRRVAAAEMKRTHVRLRNVFLIFLSVSLSLSLSLPRSLESKTRQNTQGKQSFRESCDYEESCLVSFSKSLKYLL